MLIMISLLFISKIIILPQFNAVRNAIYDIPWYLLTPQERKMILILMNIDELNFTAANFHTISLERFTDVINAAISNCLVLKTLALQ